MLKVVWAVFLLLTPVATRVIVMPGGVLGGSWLVSLKRPSGPARVASVLRVLPASLLSMVLGSLGAQPVTDTVIWSPGERTGGVTAAVGAAWARAGAAGSRASRAPATRMAEKGRRGRANGDTGFPPAAARRTAGPVDGAPEHGRSFP